MKRAALLVIALLPLVFFLSLFHLGCGVKNPNEPNWGYPTSTQSFTPTITLSPTITNSPTITPTGLATSTPMPGYYFSSSASIVGWNNNTGGTVPTTLIVSTSFDGTIACAPSVGALEVTIGFTTPGQKANVQYNLGTPTDLSGKTISSVIQIQSGFNATYPQGGYVYVQDGAPQGWASAYSNWVNAGPGCVSLNYTLPTTVTSGFDPTQVLLIGVQINANGSGSVSQTIADIFNWIHD